MRNPEIYPPWWSPPWPYQHGTAESAVQRNDQRRRDRLDRRGGFRWGSPVCRTGWGGWLSGGHAPWWDRHRAVMQARRNSRLPLIHPARKRKPRPW